MPTPIISAPPWIGIPGINTGAMYGNMGARQHWGPFEWGGAAYLVLEQEDKSLETLPKNLRVFKKLVGSETWSEVDAADRPIYYRAGVVGIHAVPPILYIAYGKQTAWSGAMTLAFVTFDLSTEQWGTPATSSVGMEKTTDSLGVVHRTSGNWYFVYDRKVGGGVRRAVYTRWNGSSFDQIEEIIDDDGFASGFGCEPVNVIAGSSGRVHVFYADYGIQSQGPTPYVYHKVLSPSDVLSGQTTVCQITLYTAAEILAEHDTSYDDFIMYHIGAGTIWQNKLVLPYVTGKKLYVAISDSEDPTTWTTYLVEGSIRPADAWHQNSIAVSGPAAYGNKLYVFWNSWYMDAFGFDPPTKNNALYVSNSADGVTWETQKLYDSLDFPSGDRYPLHHIQGDYLPAFDRFLLAFDQLDCSTTFPGEYYLTTAFSIPLEAILTFGAFLPLPGVGRVVPPGGGGGGGLCVLVPPPGIVADAEIRLEPFEREGT